MILEVFFREFFVLRNLINYLLIVIANINNSLSNYKSTLRGLHFQKAPNQEVKLVRCINGAIWDVIVDLRPNSYYFLKMVWN